MGEITKTFALRFHPEIKCAVGRGESAHALAILQASKLPPATVQAGSTSVVAQVLRVRALKELRRYDEPMGEGQIAVVAVGLTVKVTVCMAKVDGTSDAEYHDRAVAIVLSNKAWLGHFGAGTLVEMEFSPDVS